MNRESYPSSQSPLLGDISGPAGATLVTVVGIQKVPVITTLPTDQQVLTFVAASGMWEPQDDVDQDLSCLDPSLIIGWSCGHYPAGISYLGAGTLGIGDGMLGDVSGGLALTGILLYDGPDYTTILSGATSNWTLRLPVDAGTPAQVLQTDGAGNTSWVTLPAAAWSALTGVLSNGQVIPYADAGLSRLAAASLALGNGTNGDTSGNLSLTNIHGPSSLILTAGTGGLKETTNGGIQITDSSGKNATNLSGGIIISATGALVGFSQNPNYDPYYSSIAVHQANFYFAADGGGMWLNEGGGGGIVLATTVAAGTAGVIRLVSPGGLAFTNGYYFIAGAVTSGTFKPGEEIGQGSSGADTTFGRIVTGGMLVSISDMTSGYPDASGVWIGTTSHAHFTPTSTQVVVNPLYVDVLGNTTITGGLYAPALVNTQTTNYIAVPADAEQVVVLNDASACTFTVPTDSYYSSIAGKFTSAPGLNVSIGKYFVAGETITQTSSGATATFVQTQADALIVLTASITGSPDATHVWTGGTSAATFLPTDGGNTATPHAYAFPIGTTLTVTQLGLGQITLTPAGGVTTNTPSTLTSRAQYSTVRVVKTAANTWEAAGDLTGGGAAWANLTGTLSNGQVIPYADAGISRLAANSLAIGNGTNGDFSGTLKTTIVNAVTGFQVNGAAPSGHILLGNGTNYVDAAALPTGSVLWSDLGNAAADLTLANAGFNTTFNQTSAVNWKWVNTTAAVLGGIQPGLGATHVNAQQGTSLALNINIGDCVVVYVNTNSGAPTLTDDGASGGNTYTPVANCVNFGHAYAFVCLSATKTATTITAPAGNFCMEGATFINVGAVGANHSSQGTSSTALSDAVTTTAAGSLVIAGSMGSFTSFTPISGSEVASVFGGTVRCALQTQTLGGSGTVATSSATVSSSTWEVISIELQVSTVVSVNSSPILNLSGTIWNGSASVADTWSIQSQHTTATNPVSTLAITHAGSSGGAIVSVPSLAVTNLGSAGNPSITFATAPQVGMWVTGAAGNLVLGSTSQTFIQAGSSSIAQFTAATLVLLNNATLSLGSSSGVYWNSDAGISRLAANNIGVGNGTQGDYSGTIQCGNATVHVNLNVIGNTYYSGSINMRATGTATSGQNYGSATIAVEGTFYNSGVVYDYWNFHSNMGTGTAPTSTLAFSHSGSTGQTNIQIPSATVFEWSTDTGLSRIGAASLAIGNGTAGDFTGNLSYNRINKAGVDHAGQATVTAGNTTQAVTFAANYTGTGQPVIVLTPTSDPLALGVPVGYWVTYSGGAGAWTGFTVNIQTALAGNVTFNYIVVGVA